MTATIVPPLKTPPDLPGHMLVEVLFGSHLISEWSGPAELGQRIAEQQREDFSAKCTVVCTPIQPDEPQ